MNYILIAADMALALTFIWRSANADVRGIRRGLFYALGFAAGCFGTARFLSFYSGPAGVAWIEDLGQASLIAFGAIWAFTSSRPAPPERYRERHQARRLS